MTFALISSLLTDVPGLSTEGFSAHYELNVRQFAFPKAERNVRTLHFRSSLDAQRSHEDSTVNGLFRSLFGHTRQGCWRALYRKFFNGRLFDSHGTCPIANQLPLCGVPLRFERRKTLVRSLPPHRSANFQEIHSTSQGRLCIRMQSNAVPCKERNIIHWLALRVCLIFRHRF